MPRTSKIDRERKLAKGLRAQKRLEIRKIISSPNSTMEEVVSATKKLDGMPVNESPSRLRRRCSQCGRPRGVYRRFGLCRMCIRKFLNLGYLPGVVKSSW